MVLKLPVLPVNVTGLAQVPPVPPLVLNVAVTARESAFIVNTQFPVPVHEPLQPANVDPLAAVAVSVTAALPPKLALQVVPQLMPAGADVTVPLPVPAFVTLSGTGSAALNVAVTDRACVIDRCSLPVPVHAPLQPANVELLAGTRSA